MSKEIRTMRISLRSYNRDCGQSRHLCFSHRCVNKTSRSKHVLLIHFQRVFYAFILHYIYIYIIYNIRIHIQYVVISVELTRKPIDNTVLYCRILSILYANRSISSSYDREEEEEEIFRLRTLLLYTREKLSLI